MLLAALRDMGVALQRPSPRIWGPVEYSKLSGLLQ